MPSEIGFIDTARRNQTPHWIRRPRSTPGSERQRRPGCLPRRVRFSGQNLEYATRAPLAQKRFPQGVTPRPPSLRRLTRRPARLRVN